MTTEELVHALRQKGDALSCQAAQKLLSLQKEYETLGRAFDALSHDYIYMAGEYKKPKGDGCGKTKDADS